MTPTQLAGRSSTGAWLNSPEAHTGPRSIVGRILVWCLILPALAVVGVWRLGVWLTEKA